MQAIQNVTNVKPKLAQVAPAPAKPATQVNIPKEQPTPPLILPEIRLATVVTTPAMKPKAMHYVVTAQKTGTLAKLRLKMAQPVIIVVVLKVAQLTFQAQHHAQEAQVTHIVKTKKLSALKLVTNALTHAQVVGLQVHAL